MNEQDKQRVDNAKKRRSGAKTAAEQGTQNLQQQLQEKADEAGLIVADNFQAQMLVSALTFMQSGVYGQKTQSILDAMGIGTTSPLDEWSNAIQAWNQPVLPSSVSDSSG
jgi:hypothetical protein